MNQQRLVVNELIIYNLSTLSQILMNYIIIGIRSGEFGTTIQVHNDNTNDAPNEGRAILRNGETGLR